MKIRPCYGRCSKQFERHSAGLTDMDAHGLQGLLFLSAMFPAAIIVFLIVSYMDLME